MLTAPQRDFAAAQRRAILATLSRRGQPRLVPICFVLADPADGVPGTLLYSPLDEKPKRAEVRELARVRDILERPDVTLLFEHWSEDWSQLAWLRVRGRATLMEPGDDPAMHQRMVEALRVRYPQYRTQRIDALPMIRVMLTEAAGWQASG